MITITCTNCQTLLEIDDAFAGGVCRCRHCGTIQTVPALARRPTRPGAPGESGVPAPPPKPAYAAAEAAPVHRAAPTPPAPPGGLAPSGTGLDEIAAAVASSGLVGTGLTAGRLRRGETVAPASPSVDVAAKQRQTLAIVGGGAGVLLLMGILLGYALSGGKPDGTANQQNPNPAGPAEAPPLKANGSAPPSAVKRAAFLDVPLKGSSVVFLIDRGAATEDAFEHVLHAVERSLRSLAPETRFRLMFTEIRNDMPAWPETGLAQATPGNIDSALSIVKNLALGFGESRFDRPIAEAMKHDPAEMVLVTGKPDLGDNLVKRIMDAHKAAGGASRIHTVGANESPSREALSSIAARTNGEFRTLTQLREFVDKHP